jgi:hypothetical protein
MNPQVFHQRCWNHEAREAVCLCPECRHSFCRECVSEHESRLLCAACLRSILERSGPPARRTPRLRLALLALAGLFLGWLIFFSSGTALMTFSSHREPASWPNR